MYIYVCFAGETQTPSVVPMGLASAMFPATLTATTSNPLLAQQGFLSFSLYIYNYNVDLAIGAKVTLFMNMFRCQSRAACGVDYGTVLADEPQPLF